MFIKVRLYKKYDFDLCKLYIANPRYFTLQLGEALRCYVRKMDFSAQFSAFNLTSPPDVIEIKLYLDDEDDADVISYLQRILPKKRNAFIKGMFHHYLGTNTLQMFLTENTEESNMQLAEPKHTIVQNTWHQQSKKAENLTSKKKETTAVHQEEKEVILPKEEDKKTEEEVLIKKPYVSEVSEPVYEKGQERSEINEADLDEQDTLDDLLSSILNCF